jgi:hypothetical protein
LAFSSIEDRLDLFVFDWIYIARLRVQVGCIGRDRGLRVTDRVIDGHRLVSKVLEREFGFLSERHGPNKN